MHTSLSTPFRTGAKPYRVIDQIKTKLKLNVAPVQIPIGLEGNLKGVVDLVEMKAYYNEGPKGCILFLPRLTCSETIAVKEIPEDMMEEAKERRSELIATLADVDDDMAELFLAEQEPTNEQITVRSRLFKKAHMPGNNSKTNDC